MALFCLALPALAGPIHTGQVVKIADGDTLTLLVDKRPLKVRLAEIDAPERGQPFSKRAKQALSALAFQQPARVVEQDRDRYGRTVGRVYVGGRDVNAALVGQGLAWVYRRYSRDAGLLALEAEARAARRGLWAEQDPTPPWVWRRQRR